MSCAIPSGHVCTRPEPEFELRARVCSGFGRKLAVIFFLFSAASRYHTRSMWTGADFRLNRDPLGRSPGTAGDYHGYVAGAGAGKSAFLAAPDGFCELPLNVHRSIGPHHLNLTPTAEARAVIESVEAGDLVNLVIADAGSAPDSRAAPANQEPAADAGADQDAAHGAAVTLDGSASSDPDDDAVTFLWTQESGPTVALEGADTARPTFTAPDLSTASMLVFTLMVSDAAGAMDTDTVTVRVSADLLPSFGDAAVEDQRAGRRFAGAELGGAGEGSPPGGSSGRLNGGTQAPKLPWFDYMSPTGRRSHAQPPNPGPRPNAFGGVAETMRLYPPLSASRGTLFLPPSAGRDRTGRAPHRRPPFLHEHGGAPEPGPGSPFVQDERPQQLRGIQSGQYRTASSMRSRWRASRRRWIPRMPEGRSVASTKSTRAFKR